MIYNNLENCTYEVLELFRYVDWENLDSFGIAMVAAILADPAAHSDPYVSYLAIGSGTTAVQDSDVTLESELHRKQANVFVRANTIFLVAEFGQDEPTGDSLTIAEVGAFNKSSGCILGKRWVLPNTESKDNVDELAVECALTIVR